jgi:outer membrane protein TolC
MRSRALLLLFTALPGAGAAQAGPAGGADTLHLPALHAAAVDHDPRAAQLTLQEAATRLRLRALGTERLPQLAVRGEATTQSDVTSVPITLPGVDVPTPPKNRYQATLDAEQLLYDGGDVRRRQALERARLLEEQEGIRVALFPLRERVNDAFFTALSLQERLAQLGVLADDLRARLSLLDARVRAGTALSGESDAVRAELLRAGLDSAAVAADRRAALAVLGNLVGREISDRQVLALPELDAGTGAGVDTAAVRARPEYALFAGQRERLEREAAVAGAANRPRLSAFGQVGYGRPGLDVFAQDPKAFGLAGIRVRWTPWDWRAARSEVEERRLRERIVATEEAAFTERLRRDVRTDVENMARLEAALRVDDELVGLRERIERQARSQLDNGVITAADYVERRNDVFEARVARQLHRVELARARARYLTTLGVELRP